MPDTEDTDDFDLYAPDAKGEDFIAGVRSAYSEDLEAVSGQRDEMADDLRFAAGDQWTEAAIAARVDRPRLTLDHTMQHVRQVTGDIRNNRPSIKVAPVDDAADPGIANLFTGQIRHIERVSFATAVYTKGAENATICGQGSWRITTRYAADDSFDQDILIEAIPSALAVVWDRNAILPDKSDAMHCWVLQRFTKPAFKRRWPKASLDSFDRDEPEDWVSNWYEAGTNCDWITVAEFWRKVPVTKTMWRVAGKVFDVTDMPELERKALAPNGPDAMRKVESHRVMRHLVNGAEELEDAEEWNGRYIPIITMTADEIHVGDDAIVRGMVRSLKDAQRTINYHMSAMVEMIALAPRAPFIGTVKQFEGHTAAWENLNIENRPYLPYNADSQAPGPPQRQLQAEVPLAMIQAFDLARQTMSASSGIYPASLGAMSNEISGVAIRQRESQGDVGTVHYMDNLSRAIAWTGIQLIDLIPRIHDGERIMRILGEDETEEMIRVNAIKVRFLTDADGNEVLGPDGQPIPKIGPDGEVETYIENDLSRGRYDLVLSSGRSFATKRQEAVEVLTELMGRLPPDVTMLMLDIFVKNLDVPGVDELYERLRKVQISRGLIEADPEKGEKAPAPTGPSAEDIEAQAKLMEAQTRAQKMAADAGKAAAETEKAMAETQGLTIENMQALLELALQSGAVQGALAETAKRAAEDAVTGVMAGLEMRR